MTAQQGEQNKQEIAQELAAFVAEAAKAYDVPGVSVGVLFEGTELCTAHGVATAANPVPIDQHTLFHIASATKSFTATALMRLAAEGKVDFAATVRTYVPELKLADEAHAARLTVRNLLDHTGGLEWNLIDTGSSADTAHGDGTLAAFVAKLEALPLIGEPGSRASYSQAGYNLLGRVIEKVTGQPYERAVAELVLAPLGLADTVFDLDDVMTRKFAVGHNRDAQGALHTATPWKSYPAGTHGNNPGGGAASCTRDLLRWARFHLGQDTAADNEVLSVQDRRSMQEPKSEVRGSTLGDAFGFGWFLKEIGGVRAFGHGGSGNGQFAEVLMVPEHGFAVVVLSNCAPEGYQLNQDIVKWALEHFVGVAEQDPEPVAYDPRRNGDVVGRYEIDAMNLDVLDDGERLALAVGIKPEIRAASETDMPQDYPAAAMGFLGQDGDDYIITEGGLKGQRGFFTRDESGAVVGIDIAGRLFGRAN
ncbi:beta-lactamase family protein [Catenulispora sp. NF23]|uniref:Beta-lactamase family protein n=1 Tax=Catenulispora pinistramenti TaxID=2705254 RepID=A0ABS5KTI2_9ACTN|nr:serine hydrolase domain-containing protein [Catenulispora pinistramenti]MBS2534617.1 beta-lactamase family protein [Catenulispora pinistramenti]MBS2549348.1 beta-lactamase family protein [Catenulispora pinistramenti]